jgi:hypothetical protein
VSGILIGHGRLPWNEIVALADGLECAWADLTGLRIGPTPATCPPYSHLWGWSADRWVAVRIDDGDGICTELRPAPHDTELPAVPVEVHPVAATRWPDGSDRLAPHARQSLDPRPVHLLHAGDATPLVFAHLGAIDTNLFAVTRAPSEEGGTSHA